MFIRSDYARRLYDDGIAAAGIDWPDPADRHVAEAALASGAGLIVTANLRDFPPRATAALGTIAPDAFAEDLLASLSRWLLSCGGVFRP